MSEQAIFEQFMGIVVAAKQSRRLNPYLRDALDRLCDQEEYAEEWLAEVGVVLTAVIINLM